MKKVVRISLLALTAVALLGSCKKKNNEPAPGPGTGTGTNTGGNNGGSNGGGGTQTPPVNTSKYIELQLAEGQTSFTLVGLNGTDVVVEGATANVVAADGNVTEWGYSPSKPVDQNFSVVSGAKVVIKGALKSIAITAGKFKLIDLSNAPTTFEGFYFFEKGEAGTISLQELNLGDFSTLTNFYLGIDPIRRHVGPNHIPETIDLSKMVQLKQLGVHQTKVTTASSLPMLQELTLSQASASGLAKFTTANYPELTGIYGYGGRFQEGQTGLNFANHKKLVQIFGSNTHLPLPIDVSNCPTFKQIRTSGVTFHGEPKEINLLNTPKLTANYIVLNDTGTLKKEGLEATHSGWTVVSQ